MNTSIAVSGAAGTRVLFRVLAVDFELRLYEDGAEVFSAQLLPTPKDHPLNPRSTYVLRYNNNDGGAGALHVQVIEARNQEVVRYDVDLGAIRAPTVDERGFTFRTDATLGSPG
jgi:hypothetical protein